MRLPDAEMRAYTEILHAIATQKYAPGDHLIETQVAADLKMSRTPVRNALKKMIASGMLDYNNRAGCRIPVLTPHDMENVFITRIVLESQAAELASQRAAQAEIERMRDLLNRERNFYAKGEAADYTKINEALHLGIAALSKNPYLERFISQAFWRSELYIFFFDRFYYKEGHPTRVPLRDPDESQSCREHERLVSAIESGDAASASTAMRDHIRSTYETMTRRACL